jgi:predicted ribosome quality control (RQC) complex YloA/Tae2 family protein
MENFALMALVENLRPAMSDIIIRRIVQHQRNGFIFQTRSARLPAFKIVADVQNPVLYASELRPPSEHAGSDFLMVLRKHLTSAELTGVAKPLSERIVELKFKTVVPTKELEMMSLIVELLPNSPNIILLDAERRVLASFLPITPQHGIAEYDTYEFPKPGDKLDLETLPFRSAAEFSNLTPESLVAQVAGLGPIFARELVHRQRKSGRPLKDEIQAMIEQVRAPSRAAWLYTELPLGHILEQNDVKRLQKAILSPIALESLARTHSSRVFPNILEAARFYFDELESRTLLEQAKVPVLRDLRQVGKRFADREKRLLREQQKYEEAEGLQRTAQLLASSGMKMDEHYSSATVTDYFAAEPQPMEVPLDGTLTLRENIERMFKRQQKAVRGKAIVARHLAEIRDRRAALEEQTKRLQAIKDWDTWLAIASRLPARTQQPAAPAAVPDSARRFRTICIDDREILVGRGARENDELTFGVAAPEDFWFHVADYSGSHVIVRNPGKDESLEPGVLEKAAQLAAFFSQARNSPKVEVHYTKRKHVTRLRRAKPGLVRLLEFQSINVEPKNWLNASSRQQPE